MLNNREQKTVLITGGAKRIGAEIARKFAENHYQVAIHANHSLEEATHLLKMLAWRWTYAHPGKLKQKRYSLSSY